MALLGSLDPTKPVPGFADMESAIRHLPDSNIRDVLLSHVGSVGQDVTRLRDGVATWFDQTMDRLSGVYKRKLKIISFIVGFLLAIAVNADTITVANALWHDNVLRDQIVQIASRTPNPDLLATGPQKEPSMSAVVSFPLFFVFHRAGFMLPGFSHIEPDATPPETASVTGSPASSVVVFGCRTPQCIRNSPPSSLRVWHSAAHAPARF